MRRKHHRRYQGLFTRLASLARSLTAPAAAGLLLALAALLVIMPAQGKAQSAAYRVTFEGKWTTSATADGVPGGAHFSPLIGAVHNDQVTFWSEGGTASAGIESMAEVGGTNALKTDITAAGSNAGAVIERIGNIGATATVTADFTVTSTHPLVTLLTMVAPSPDWFVGVSGLSLRNATDDGWQPSLTVDLFPYDAGTEEGTEFSPSNAATSPQGTITSIKGTGKFSDEPIASLTFTLQAVAPEITSETTFTVDEGTTAVATLTAEDQDSAAADLEWSKAGGADAGQFMLSAAGELAFAAAPDYENPGDADGDRTYEITVQVSDGDDTDTADILVTLQNVLELFTELEGPSSTDYAENGAVRVAAYTASSEADRDGIAWQLGGDDAEYFSIDNPLGVLRFHIDPVAPSLFLQPPDYEAPVDDDGENDYEVIVFAQAGSALTLKSVFVTVTDENEAGTLTLSSSRPRLGTALTATLSDPDTVSGTPTWQWERSAGRNTWVVIDGAEAASYTPTAADTGAYLRVTATYTDSHAADQSAGAVSAEVVAAELLSSLAVTTNASTADSDRWAMRPDFSADILHYAVGCTATDPGDTMTLTFAAANAGTRVAVNGKQAAAQNAMVEVVVDGTSAVPITLTGSNGTSTTYVVHCMDSRNPAIERTIYEPGASTELISVYAQIGPTRRQIDATYLAIIDANGVPRWQRRLNTRASHFKAHPDGKYPYSYGHYRSSSYGYRMVILDENLKKVDEVTTTDDLQRTGAHDFAIRENGNYVFEAYEPAYNRDFSAYTDENGNPYGTSEETEDSIIEEVNPDGERVFFWNSWNDMYLNDCLQHRFPNDYAHINSVQVVDEADIIASFRGCSQVWRIDRETGAGEWLLGRSNRRDAEWERKGIRMLKIVGDPHGEFCGQHSARLIPNGHLVLFDNGWHCLEDPETGDTQRTDWGFSRVVEYALDFDNGEAVFVRQHCLGNECEQFSEAQGHIHRMDSGHWLVSWGRGAVDNWDRTGPYPEASLTEVDPLTNEELLSFKITHPDFYIGGDVAQPTRAYPVEFVALADMPGPLGAEIAESSTTSVFHLGPTDAPKVVVAFNQPVADPDPAATTWPWVNVQGATIAGISPHVVPGDPANAYLFTLTPTGVGPITFALVAGQSCASGGICTADGTVLTEVPASHVIPPRTTGPAVASITSSATHPAKDGFTVTITFSEPVTGLTAGEIEVTNGTGSNFGGAEESYTLEIAPDAGIEDEVTVTVTPGAVVDGLNNGNLQASAAFSVDTKAPTVSTIAITSNPGSDRTYAAGDEIRVTVTFSETVEVEGTPRLQLELGGGVRTAAYRGGTGTAALVFAYEVAYGERDSDGVGVEADSLTRGGGTIRDGSDNDAVLDHDGLAADSGHKVDGVRPELAASGGAVVDGTRLTLSYDEPLDTRSPPASGDFTVAGSDQARTVTRVRVSGSTVVLTLDSGAEHEEAGILVSYTPGTNPIRDVPGNQAEALSRQSVRNETPDTTPPEVESLAIGSNPGSDRTYAAGDEIEVRVQFSETVEVEGRPQLRLRVGSRTRTAGYESGTGTAVLVFGYEVAEGDEDTDGVSIEAGRIALNGGTIKDEAENPAALAHGAVAPQAGHQVDGVRPAFVSAAVDGSSLTLTYGEALDGGSRPASGDFTVEVGGSGRSVTGVSVSGSLVTLTLNPAVEHGDTGIRVSYAVPTGVGANPIRDAVGNQARGLSNRSVTNTTGAPNTAPEITSTSSFDVRENRTVARRLAARDTDPGDEVTGWAIVGGADQSQFSIASDTGELSFREAPDYEMPVDLASPVGDNEYVVEVSVRSGAGARELEVEQTFTIRVTDEREPPGVPEAPTFSGETADSLTVSWTEPENTGPAITDYDVQYREKGTGRFIDGDQQGPGLTLTLTDLEPGTVYEVQVRARNEEGTSDWSASGKGMTVTPLTVVMASGADPPVSGPFTVRFSYSEPVTGFSRSDIETGQDPACVDDRNNPVFCDPGIGTLQTADDRVFTTTVTPWTDPVAHSYTLRLTVAGGAVRSLVGSKPNEEPEEPLEVRVSPPEALEPISSIGFQASPGNGSVRLSWNRPSDNGGSAIIRYEYRYAATGEAWSEWENVGAGTRSVTVGNLVNGREYVFEVRAVSALGKGGVETVTATPELRVVPPGNGGGGALLFPPEAPAGLMATAGDGAVRLEWSPPESDGGTAILRYEYRLKEGRGEFGEWTPIPDSAPDEVNASGYTVGGLGNGTVYAIELRAVNAAGSGQVSEAVEVVMRLDPAYWSNFRAEDLQGARLMLEAFLSSGSSGDRELRFGEELRFEEDELDGEGEVTATRTGSYGYRYTSRTTGRLQLDFDVGEACELRLTFTGEGEGSYVYRCGGALEGQGSFRLIGLNRVPEITSVGPFEVEENQTRAGQVEAVDWDEEDAITGYGITGGADRALFAIEAETGELSFRTAPDYENPGDVASEDPQSPAGDNEYMVVVEVRSGEGERERTREQGIRVRVSDVEMEEAGGDEMGEDETGSLFIPVILSSAGRNQSFFTSELTLTNRGEQDVRLDYTYTADRGEGSGTASDVLPAGRQKIETDALTYLRGLGVPIPETGNQLGTLRVEVELGSEVEAVVRTTTMVPDGRAGLAYLGVAQEEGFEEAVYLCGLRQNSQDRSNVAFQNMGTSEEGAITLKTTVYSGEAADATARVLKNVKLRPGEFHQYSGLLGSVENGYVKVERVEGTAPFYAYGVINDQANSDGSFVFPVTASSLEGAAGQTLPVIVETSAFRSELTVTNFSEESRKLDFQFVADGIETDDKTAAFSMTLEAGQQEIIPDVVEELRRQGVAGLGATRGFYAGPVFATAEEGDMNGIVIGARTGSEGGGGSYSVFYNAVPFGEAFRREAWVDGLQQNQENRSNLALVNTGEVDESPSVFHLEIYDGETGLLAETVVTKPIPARGWHQINGILGRSSPETLQGYIRIEKVSGQNPFLAYGVVNDGGAPGQRSGDGAYLPARE